MSDSSTPGAPQHVGSLVSFVLVLPLVSVLTIAIFLNWGR